MSFGTAGVLVVKLMSSKMNFKWMKANLMSIKDNKIHNRSLIFFAKLSNKERLGDFHDEEQWLIPNHNKQKIKINPRKIKSQNRY